MIKYNGSQKCSKRMKLTAKPKKAMCLLVLYCVEPRKLADCVGFIRVGLGCVGHQ